MILLLVYVGFALGVSFFCSLLEAALLSVRSATLTERADLGSRGARLLLELKQHRLADAISAILTLNTMANTLGATLAGAQAAQVFGSARVGIFSGVLTFLILVLSEIIPKTLGAVYASSLAGFVGWSLHFLTRGMTPVLLLSRKITGLLTRGRKNPLSRGELSAIIETATRDGAISSDESKIFTNLLRFDRVQVEDVMTPRTVIFQLAAEATITDLLAAPEGGVFSRIPLYEGDPENVVGYVLTRDVLESVARHGGRERPLREFLRPISFVPELATVGAALSQILAKREPIAMATDEHGGLAGLITLEDLTETILGVEIVDESDRVADMREAASRLREERLERQHRKRQVQLGSPAGSE